MHNHQEMLKTQGETIQESYEAEEDIYKKIYSLDGGFAEYVGSLPGLEAAFEDSDRIGCMDEGTTGCKHCAGSLIRMTPEQIKTYITESKAKKITSHDGCGAAGLYAKENGLDLSQKTADKYAEDRIREIATEYGLEYDRNITAGEMKRPKEGHFARTCYYDLTGKFNWDKVDGVPAGFVVSRKFMDQEYASGEVKIAASIAFGHHGLGERLTEEEPFMLVVIAEDKKQLAKATVELQKLSLPYGRKVRIDGFVAPK